MLSRRWTIVLVLVLLEGCASSVRFTTGKKDERPSNERKDNVLEGYASFYADEFHGRKTANGETYDMNALTAAHRSLPFGTMVRVKNTNNGKSIVVRINDRGPFKDNRIIDLSLAAAKQIGLIGPGTALVELEILGSEKQP